jgi:hypothetical protein
MCRDPSNLPHPRTYTYPHLQGPPTPNDLEKHPQIARLRFVVHESGFQGALQVVRLVLSGRRRPIPAAHRHGWLQALHGYWGDVSTGGHSHHVSPSWAVVQVRDERALRAAQPPVDGSVVPPKGRGETKTSPLGWFQVVPYLVPLMFTGIGVMVPRTCSPNGCCMVP